MYQLLNGVRVVEFTAYWPDAVGQYLADLGADVFKIEEPERGSLTRQMGGRGPDLPPVDLVQWNRSKKSVGLNVKTAAGRDTFLEVVQHVDIVVDGLRAGALDDFGVGYEAARAVNPRIVYVAISGWGQTGPYRRLAGHGAGFDAWPGGMQPPAQRPDGLPTTPYMPGTTGEAHFGTIAGTLHAALGAVAGLVHARETGEGAFIDVAHADAGASVLFDKVYHFLNLPDELRGAQPSGSSRNDYYPTKDGKHIYLQPLELKFWRNFCEGVGRPDLIEVAGKGMGQRLTPETDEWLRQEMAAISRTKTRAEWVEFLIEHNTVGTPVNETIEEMLEDPQFLARDLLREVAGPRGALKVFGTPVKVQDQEFEVRPYPELGAHTDELLSSAGFSEEQMAELRAGGHIG